MRITLLIVLMTTSGAVWSDTAPSRRDDGRVEAISLLGRPLVSAAATDAEMLAKLEAARQDWLQDRESADALIWLGRRTAYLGRYGEAIDLYTRGIDRHPEDARLYRHRGHRYISIRKLARAIADLEHATRLIQDRADEVEPDGLPNDRGIPTSTLNGNIHYHLGLAYYLSGRFADARGAFQRCLATARNPDMESAARYWLYLSAMRAGDASAKAILTPVKADWDIIENASYHRLLLHYRGNRLPDIEDRADPDPVQNATLAYGLAMAEYVRGDLAAWEVALRAVIDGPQWAAFGHIAAEADLARLVP